jgi:hypothetical protein
MTLYFTQGVNNSEKYRLLEKTDSTSIQTPDFHQDRLRREIMMWKERYKTRRARVRLK